MGLIFIKLYYIITNHYIPVDNNIINKGHILFTDNHIQLSYDDRYNSVVGIDYEYILCQYLKWKLIDD